MAVFVNLLSNQKNKFLSCLLVKGVGHEHGEGPASFEIALTVNCYGERLKQKLKIEVGYIKFSY